MFGVQAGVLKDLITIFEWATEDLPASSVKIEDYLWILSAVTLRTSPPHQEGFESLPAGGFVSQGSRRSPPHQEGIESLPAGGFVSRARAQGSRRPPTRQEGHLPPREVSLPPGGQNPNTLEYQIYPPTIDILVTGMDDGALVEEIHRRYLLHLERDGGGVEGVHGAL